MFPLAVWNVNKTTLNNCNRAIKNVEEWNNRFSKLVGQNMLQYGTLLGNLK